MVVAIIYGGKSAEHDISIRSAKNVWQNLDRTKYTPLLIKIEKNGDWFTDKSMILEKNFDDIQDFTEFKPTDKVLLNPSKGKPFVIFDEKYIDFDVDVIFPVLHGPNGEDGSVQGVLTLLDIPFVGPGILGSAASMDKEVTKRLLQNAGINIGEYLVAKHGNYPSFSEVEKALRLPVYIKPANMGSSVGISKVSKEEDYKEALKEAYRYDNKLVIEANIIGREIECAVLGNTNPKASPLGEIISQRGFYDYSSKYLDDADSSLVVNADIDVDTTHKIRETAIKVFQVMECEGLSRVDFFLTKDNKIFVNEINTIPGFTSISMYPKLWSEAGISQKDLISKLLEFAISRHNAKPTIE